MVLAPQGKRTLSHRVFATIFLCAMAVIVAFTVLGAFFVQNTLADATSANLSQETELIAAALNEQQEPIAFLRSFDREDLRITLINKDGSVAYDNEASPSMLPNHGDRPEVVKAFENGSCQRDRNAQIPYPAPRAQYQYPYRQPTDTGAHRRWFRTATSPYRRAGCSEWRCSPGYR